MKITPTAIADVLLIEPKVFGDDRGFFFESYNARELGKSLGLNQDFVQDNHSQSVKGVLRGLHYQLPPHAQGKLVRVVQGEVFDVAVDLRKSSPTFGHWVGEILSAVNKKQIWIPEGFAHGFLTLSESAELLYKTTNFWVKTSEGCIAWNDPNVGINWPHDMSPKLSEKDNNGYSLSAI